MTLKSEIEEISARSQLVEIFSTDLKAISDAIGEGTAARWKAYNGAQLLRNLQGILVEREFAFYAGQNFYAGTGVKRISSKKQDSDLNSSNIGSQPDAEDKKDSSLGNPKEIPPADLFFLPWLPDPISLPLALTIDWSENQRSALNETLLQNNHLQYTSHPGRTRKSECTLDSSTNKIKGTSKKLFESFGKVSGWCGHSWKYFPAFFVLAFLILRDSDLRLLKKALTPGSRGFKAIKPEKLQSLCSKVSSLTEQANLEKIQKPNASSAKTKAQLMREYIVMSAFMSLICRHQDDAIENLLLLDYLTGLCTALLGYYTMQSVLECWKNSESEQSNKSNGFDDILRKIESTMLRTADYNEDNIISRMENEPGFYYWDNISKIKNKCYQIAKHSDWSAEEKLNELIILQFNEIDKLSTRLMIASSNEKLSQAQRDSKKKALDLYFSARASFLKKEPIDVDFTNIIDALIEGLRAVESTLKCCMSEDTEEEASSDKDPSLKNVEVVKPLEKKCIPLSVEAQGEISRYKGLQSTWIKFFLVRRMQNGEQPTILFCLGDSDIEPIAEQIFLDIARHYPTELWPHPKTIK